MTVGTHYFNFGHSFEADTGSGFPNDFSQVQRVSFSHPITARSLEIPFNFTDGSSYWQGKFKIYEVISGDLIAESSTQTITPTSNGTYYELVGPSDIVLEPDLEYFIGYYTATSTGPSTQFKTSGGIGTGTDPSTPSGVAMTTANELYYITGNNYPYLAIESYAIIARFRFDLVGTDSNIQAKVGGVWVDAIHQAKLSGSWVEGISQAKIGGSF